MGSPVPVGLAEGGAICVLDQDCCGVALNDGFDFGGDRISFAVVTSATKMRIRQVGRGLAVVRCVAHTWI